MSPAHPQKEQLMAFGQGKLGADESSSVELHLEVCRECCETLLDLKDDTFIGLVRIAQPSESDRRMGTLVRPEMETGKTESDKAGTGKSAHPTEGGIANDSAHSATMLVQSGEAVSVNDLPDELQDHPRYRIVELIGRGGMGNVYRAEHRLMNRPVALKLINSQLIRQPQAVERFRREVQAAAKLTHPNIVTAYDAEQAGDVHFLVMEFVEGTDLASVVKHRGPMSVTEACECIRQAAEGLQHAHEKGMVHRDIKPHNLMLSAEGQVRILDFGLAGFVTETALERSHVHQNVGDTHVAPQSGDSGYESPPSGDGGYEMTAAHLTTAGSVMGTPDYIAPEQIQDAHSADIRADIYSLGCTLHFLLTGKPPFVADNVIAKLKAHAQEAPPALTALRKDVPLELQEVAWRMLAKNPAERFQTPADVVAALQPFTQSVPFRSAKGRSFAERKTTLAAVLCFVLLLAGVIVVTTNRGRLEIHSEVEDVKVAVTKGGEQVEVFDLKTGSQMKWLPSGEYELQVVGRDNDVKLDKAGFTMSRLGRVIITANWNAAGRGVVRAFSTDEKPITQDGVTSDDGGWKIMATAARTVRLFEVPNPKLDIGPFFFRAKLKTENVTGRAYLEMWTRFPGKGEFFSKGLHNAISGTNGWAEYEIPFFLKKGEESDLVKLNVTIEGTGTVWIKDIELRGRTIGEPPKSEPKGKTEKPAKTDQGVSPLASLKDSFTVLTYLNNPRNNTGGSVPVALLGQQGRVAFRFGTWLVVFEGIACDPKASLLGFSSFNIPLPGSSGEGTIDFGAGDKLPGVLIKFKFADEQNEISINNNRFKLRGKATRLEFGDKAYDATNAVQTILVARDGTTRLEPAPAIKPAPVVQTGVNLINDPSLETTALNQLPLGWSAWLNDGPDFRGEVVNGGHTGQRSLHITGKGTRGVVFANSVPLDRSKRYALKGWAKFEGDKDARAIIKFNYFRAGKWLGVHDLVGVTADQPGWHLLEKTDAAEAYPEATLLVPTCHVEGSGTGWFDDLELIAYDRDKLPTNFDAMQGKNNRLIAALDFDRWVGEWDATFEAKPTDQADQDHAALRQIITRKVLGDRFLMTYSEQATVPMQFVWFLTHDSNFAAYRLWIFGNGEAVERRGQWDSAGEMLTLDLVPLSPGATGKRTDHFIGLDRIETSVFVKSADGRVRMTRETRWTSRKKSPQPDKLPEIQTAAAPAAQPEELAMLNKFAGDWTIRSKSKPSIWLPNGGEEMLTEKVAWILGGRFLMARTFNEKDELTSIWLATYEQSEKSNRFWFFNADGSSGQWRVTWDAASRGFHWRSIDMPTGWIGTGFNRWINDDTFDNQALIKDEQGRVLLDGTQDKRRKK